MCSYKVKQKNKNGGVRDWLNKYSVHGGETRLIHFKRKGE